MISETCPLNSLRTYRYVVVFAKADGKWVFCKHKERSTWETAGGHIEPGETPLEAAGRELYEESGAADFSIAPVFDYRAADGKSRSNGMVFYAEIRRFGDLPQFEMERVECFGGLPAQLTYPAITPVLFERMESVLQSADPFVKNEKRVKL